MESDKKQEEVLGNEETPIPDNVVRNDTGTLK
jgi:hypothetical protein